VNLHQTLPEVEIKNCFPLRNIKGEQTGSILFIVSKTESSNKSNMFSSQIYHQPSAQVMPHLGLIEKNNEYSALEGSFDLEDEKTQLQIIQQELNEQCLS